MAPVQLEFEGEGLGYLVLQSGGEFADVSLVLVDDGTAALATEPDDVPFGVAYDDSVGALHETWTTGDGARLYTRVRVEGSDPAQEQFTVHSWTVTDGALVPTELGVACFDDDVTTVVDC